VPSKKRSANKIFFTLAFCTDGDIRQHFCCQQAIHGHVDRMPRRLSLLIALSLAGACDDASLHPAEQSPEQTVLNGKEPPDAMPPLTPLPGSDTSCPNGQVNPKVDVLFIIDDSMSMTNSQALMKQQASRLIGRLTQMQLDYHIALTTTSLDGARRVPGALVSSQGVKVISRTDSLSDARRRARSS
jgi:hypothetical protein